MCTDNEETFYHCDQLIKGMYTVFLRRWRREFRRCAPAFMCMFHVKCACACAYVCIC